MTNKVSAHDCLTKGLDSPTRRLWELCSQYSELARRVGHHIAPYHPDSLGTRFQELPEERQQACLEMLETSIEISIAASNNSAGERIGALNFVWFALRKFNLRPRSDLFASLEDSDLIEIYSASGTQVFRSFNMFDHLSYTLEELVSYEWWELYDRDENITQDLIEVAERLVNQPERGTYFFKTSPHIVRERFSFLKCEALIRTKLGSPLFLPNGDVGGYLSASTIVQVLEAPITQPAFHERAPLRLS